MAVISIVSSGRTIVRLNLRSEFSKTRRYKVGLHLWDRDGYKVPTEQASAIPRGSRSHFTRGRIVDFSCHKKHKRAQKMKWPKVNQLCVLFEKRCVAANALRARIFVSFCAFRGQSGYARNVKVLLVTSSPSHAGRHLQGYPVQSRLRSTMRQSSFGDPGLAILFRLLKSLEVSRPKRKRICSGAFVQLDQLPVSVKQRGMQAHQRPPPAVRRKVRVGFHS